MKTLFIDIETSPNIGLFWRAGYKINISHNNILKERSIICICYKWMGKPGVHSLEWDRNQCDKKMLKKITKVIHEADEIVGHNGDKFDIKYINGRLAYHDLPPLGPLSTTDTLKQSRKVFYLNSQKLDYLGQFFKLGEKLETGGFSLWKSILMDKCPKSMKKMVKYCCQDVRLLEKVYKRIMKYAPRFQKGRHADNGLESCPNCGAKNYSKCGFYCTTVNKFQRVGCRECGTAYKFKI